MNATLQQKSLRFIALTLLFCALLAPVPSQATGSIIIVDIVMAHLEDGESTEGAGFVIIEDELMYLVSSKDRLVIQDDEARALVGDVIGAPPPTKNLQFTIEQDGDHTRLTIRVIEDGRNIIIDDTVSL